MQNSTQEMHLKLAHRGFEVCLVNARHVKNVPGRRTDVSDCQWLQFLHSVGLLRASYRPEQEVCAIRSLLRHRESLVQMAATHVNHMQKALDRLNVKIHVVIRDITGVSGMKIIQAILAGQRDPELLVGLCDQQILKTKKAPMLEALRGLWRKEHLFALRLALESYQNYQQQIAQCDAEIAQVIQELSGKRVAGVGGGDAVTGFGAQGFDVANPVWTRLMEE